MINKYILMYDSKKYFDELFCMHLLFLDELSQIRDDIANPVLDIDAEKEIFIKNISVENTDCFLVKINDIVIGYSISYLCKTLDPMHFVKRKFAFLDEIYIYPNYRNKGYATELITHLKSFYKSKGVAKMELYLLYDNHSAYNTYLKNGFVVQSLRMEVDL